MVTHHFVMGSDRRAFTLIELLVVISIISLLISILLPALSAARASARNVQCLSSIRQIGLAIEMYSQDNGGYVPASRAEEGLPTTQLHGRHNLLGRLYHNGYVTTGEAFICPEAAEFRYARHAVTHPDTYYAWDWTTYGINHGMVSSDTYEGLHRLDLVKSPAIKILGGDSLSSSTLPELRGISRLWWGSTNEAYIGGRLHDRHTGAANVLFMDMHAVSVRDAYTTYQFPPRRDGMAFPDWDPRY